MSIIGNTTGGPFDGAILPKRRRQWLALCEYNDSPEDALIAVYYWYEESGTWIYQPTASSDFFRGIRGLKRQS